MTGLRPALAGIGLLGILLIAATVMLALSNDDPSSRVADAALGAGVMTAYIGAGLLAWYRRPHNAIGPLLCAVGFTFVFNALTLSDVGWLFALGTVFGALFFVVFIHLVLAFPSGRVEGRLERRLLGAAYAIAILIPLGISVFSADLASWDDGTPANPILIADRVQVAEAIDEVGSVVGSIVIATLVALIVRRWLRATPPARRVLTPILVCGGVMIVLLAALLLTEAFAGDEGTVQEVMSMATLVPFMLLPFVFVVGLLRSRWARASAVEDLVERLGGQRGSLRQAVADALGDPTVELAYWLDGEQRFVTDDGQAVTLPGPADPRRAATEVRHGDALVGAMIFDRTREDEPELVAAAASAAALAMENGRLEAELRARVADLQESRARLVTEGMAERRRLERDLHDGAQQRLVSLSLQLGLARGAVDRDPQEARELLDRAATELNQALDELRELARGLHPAILTDRGLPAAIDALAARSPTPVDVEAVPDERLPAAVEAAAYFVVSEALANLAKHAEAEHAMVRVERVNGHAVVEVRDDGRGGADAGGHGLRGLSDRVAALDGRLAVESPPGKGTTIRAEIPCASS
ncbi:MAG: hypothetical protein JHC84_13560 [Solirubrobacteraceae bacterium]|nr:hypothetical protein [Solirubrobacteraceae bacterium]